MALDDSPLRVRTLRGAAITTCVAALVSAVYVASTWDGPNRPLLLAIAAGACLEAAAILRFVGPLLRSDGACERFIFAWGTWHVAVIAWLCVLDGGVESPFVSIFLVSVAFAGGALPRRGVMALAAINAAAIVAVAIFGPDHGHFHAEAVVWGGALLTIAGICASIAEHRSLRGAELAAAREELPRRLARVVEYRDDDTGAHVERMAVYAEQIARALGLPEGECRRIRLASAMHDIGKVAVPDAILLKPGPLSAEERAVMQTHAQVGHEMLSGSGSDLLDLAATIALTHHERYDGDGYPQGLRGEDIPLAGRIVAVADVFDAVTSKRVYKDAVPAHEAIEIVRRGRGTHFDPKVVDAFEHAIAARVPAADPARSAALRADTAGAYVGAAIHSAGRPVGVICAFGTEPREITARDREALVTLARQAETHLEVRRRNLELRDLALTDPLTGLANRTLVFDRLQQALANRVRAGQEVGVLFCDVDDFKRVNDRLGHEAGDALLCAIADTLRSVARSTDTVGRIAGDEFVLVCPHLADESDLDAVQTRMAEAAARQRPLSDGSLPPRISVGAVLARPADSAADALRRADSAMYEAKAHARRVPVR